MARKKSLQDMMSQMRRIALLANEKMSNPRVMRAKEAYTRYRKNIEKTDTWKKDYKNYFNAVMSNGDDRKYLNIERNRKYSQNTYMGLSNG